MKKPKKNQTLFGTDYSIKTYIDALTWLNVHEEEIVEKIKRGDLPGYFDYPEYWDMPKEISYQLSPDQVDWIQNMTTEYSSVIEVEKS